ncbi:MAG: hypothetical protein AAGI72_23920 [Pseudomonadota bacterium]
MSPPAETEEAAIVQSRMLTLGSSGTSGSADVSPKGDPAGFLAFRDRLRKHAMHLAATLALLGALVRGVPALLSSDELRLATMSQLVMGVAMIVFLILCVRSFIAARRALESES